MEKRILIEELNMFRMLSNYNPKKTLTENFKELKEIKPTALNKGIQFIEKDAQIIMKDLQDLSHLGIGGQGGGVADVMHHMKFNTIRNTGDLVNLMTKSMSELDNMFTQALKNEINAGHVVKAGSELGAESKDIAKAIALRQISEKRAWLETLPLSQQAKEIDNIINDVKQKSKTRAFEIHGGQGGGPHPVPPPTGIPQPPPPYIPPPDPKPWWRKYWKEALLIGGGAGLLALLNWWMNKGRKEVPFPPCITIINSKIGFTEKDLEKFSQINGAYLPMAVPNMVDSSGGKADVKDAKFFEDGTFEANGSKGMWKDMGSVVQVVHNGNTYYIDCSYKEEKIVVTAPPPPVVTREPNPTDRDCPNGFMSCSQFPFRKCCQAKEIADVQGCLGIGADGKFGRSTESVLGKAYLTKTMYDEIMRDCEKGEKRKGPEPINLGGTDL